MRTFRIIASFMACAGCLSNASPVDSNATNVKSDKVSRIMLNGELRQAEKEGIQVCSDHCGML